MGFKMKENDKVDTIFYVIESKNSSAEYLSREGSDTKYPSTFDIYEAIKFLDLKSAEKVIEDMELQEYWEVTEHMFQITP